ncbi:hypothetical protein SLS58_007153 [Diplodia intermedia]|uniref:Uncharacterized protein n=1 Tax=Diplodia intermedia TaxID=856260 RepID=A0ABR3TKX2_9PEZI
MSRPIPIIVCGATQKVAAMVKSNMLPEYDVVYAGHDLPSTLHEVPLILAGTPPPGASLHTQLGSNDFLTSPPRAVVAGGGYGDDAFRALFAACVAACGGNESDLPVPFFRVDNDVTARLAAEGRGPPLPEFGKGPAAAAVPGREEYSRAIAGRLKGRIGEVVGEGVGEGEGRGKVFGF